MEAFLGGRLEPFRRCLFRTRSSFLCSHISRAHRIGSSSMTFSLYSAQLFRYDGALSLNSTRESTVSQDDKFTHTQNSEDDVGGDGQKRFSKDIHPIRRVSHFPFLSVHKICLLYNAMQFTFCTM